MLYTIFNISKNAKESLDMSFEIKFCKSINDDEPAKNFIQPLEPKMQAKMLRE